MKHQSSLTWNDFQNKVNIDMYSEHDTKIKETLKKYFFNQFHFNQYINQQEFRIIYLATILNKKAKYK